MQITRAEINLTALHHNYDAIRRQIGPQTKLMAVVKTNAYGHGMIEVSKALSSYGVEYLAVGSSEEGIILRQQNITVPILVLGGVLKQQISALLSHDLVFTVSSYDLAEAIDGAAAASGVAKAKVHLKVDTGMGRYGALVPAAPEFVERVSRLRHLDVAGIFSHFATADQKDKTFSREQIQTFRRVLDEVRERRIEIPNVHFANTSAVLDLPETYFTMVRPGIGLYGVYPSQETSRSISLEPVLSLRSRVVSLKEVPPGTTVSYGRRYRTASRTRIAVIPVGYADGFGRRLSGHADVLLKGRRYPVVGSICMDNLMVDLGMETPVELGDDVTFIGKDGEESISVWDLALALGEIPYEILTGIAARVPRAVSH